MARFVLERLPHRHPHLPVGRRLEAFNFLSLAMGWAHRLHPPLGR
jgi:hypothetical protein